jgi:hypothetical protein
MVKLNGWYRLWVVISVLWLGICAAIYWDSFSLLYENKTAKFELTNPSNEIEKRVVRVVFPKNAAESEIGEYIDKIVAEYGDHAYSKVPDSSDVPYRSYVSKERPKLIKYFSILVALPIVALLLLGLAISWVVSGFRKKQKNA